MTIPEPTDEQVAAIKRDLLEIVNECAERWRGVHRVRKDMGRGYPPVSGGGGHPAAGSISDPTFSRATTVDPDPSVAAQEALERWWAAVTELRHLRRMFRSLVPEQPIITRTSTIGTCEGCGRDVARTAVDPMRNGLCSGCDQAYRRWSANPNNTGDRGDFIAQRRRLLGTNLGRGPKQGMCGLTNPAQGVVLRQPPEASR